MKNMVRISNDSVEGFDPVVNQNDMPSDRIIFEFRIDMHIRTDIRAELIFESEIKFEPGTDNPSRTDGISESNLKMKFGKDESG